MPPAKKKTAASTKTSRPKKTAEPVTRFAHPYFTPVPPNQRSRMTDHVQGTLNPIPARKRATDMTLADVLGKDGADKIAATKQIIIHVAGDTGVPEIDTETKQVLVADAMTKDYDVNHPDTSPAFFLHLGDVIYGPNPASFRDQFYRAYMHYPGKILAIPGNHDGETADKMKAFQDNFCAPTQAVPAIAGSVYRQTLTEPGVYWFLDAPFVQIVGLYSNSAENPGYISGPKIGQVQKQWLVNTLKTIKASRATGGRKALLFATHHPPYSSGGHGGSTDMLNDIDDACKQAGIMYDAFFSGHAHSIQRYTKSVNFGGTTRQIPYIVSGCGGHGGQAVAPPPKVPTGNPTYDFSHMGWGFTTLNITSTTLTITSFGVDANGNRSQIDSKTVNLT
ncbi:MAG TPA: metallophosphoesterase [Anaerolineae bacterium]